jgi:hypothetical protein
MTKEQVVGRITFDQGGPSNMRRSHELEAFVGQPPPHAKTEYQMKMKYRMRAYFVFVDALDEDGVNLSYIEAECDRPQDILAILYKAAATGKLWRNLYPAESGPGYKDCYKLLPDKVMWIDITNSPEEWNATSLIREGKGKNVRLTKAELAEIRGGKE